MIPQIREQYNRAFTAEKYAALLKDVQGFQPGGIDIRIAETPVFIPRAFKRRLLGAGEEVLGILAAPDFRRRTREAIPAGAYVPHETRRPEFIVMDFAVVADENQQYAPRLIKLQGFPSMNAFQPSLAACYRRHFPIPEGFSAYLSGYDEDSYWNLLSELVLAGHNPREVVLLAMRSPGRGISLDSRLTRERLGVEPVWITELVKEGRKLFYRRGKEKIRIRRIYNRLTFDEASLQGRKARRPLGITHHRLDVEWASHPNWFYRVSKYLLPLLKVSCVPAAYFLNKLEVVPTDLDNYVLKPLLPVCDREVVLEVRKEHLDRIRDPENWVLQRKVAYAPVIRTPGKPAACEIRLMYYWNEGSPEPVVVQNRCRLTTTGAAPAAVSGKPAWTGEGICFFEQD